MGGLVQGLIKKYAQGKFTILYNSPEEKSEEKNSDRKEADKFMKIFEEENNG